jgi:putative ABC transport system ATP-binding protein
MKNKQLSLKICNLKFSYENNKTILDIPLLEIEKGSKVFIHGPSGHGKSTLLNIISGVLPFKNGEVFVLKNNLKLLSPLKKDQLRGAKIGYIFQIFNLIPYLNIFENITLPCMINKNRSEGLDFKMQAHNLINKLGLEEIIYQSIQELSIGQQQRVAQGRALIGSPELVIADEPTSSLDELNTQYFMELLLSEWEEKKFTLIFVSHDERLKKYFDHIIDLKNINKA